MAPPKGSRRAPSSLSNVTTLSPATNAARATKSTKPSKIVQLQVPTAFLSNLDGALAAAKGSQNKVTAKPSSSSSSASTSSGPTSKSKIGGDSTPPIKMGDMEDAQSPEKSVEPATEDNGKAGIKREADAIGSDDPKSKIKGPQRKRPKVGENGRLDGRTAAAKAAGFVAGAHKLGPKANQGAINEKLRALDRTKKPCRKWAKSGFKLKSFTGQVWEMPTWNSPQIRAFRADPNSQGTSNPNQSKENSSSNVGSDHNSPAVGPTEGASSPAVAPVA